MHFVDDIDFVARRHCRVAHSFNNFAHIVDAGVACSIHFDHIDMSAFGNCHARLANTTWVDSRAALPVLANAIQRFGNQPRGGGFANPAHAGHKERMRQPVTFYRVTKRLHHGILTNQLGKSLRTVFARQHAIRHPAR